MTEALESRRLMSATVTHAAAPAALPPPADGVLRIHGTDVADRINVFRTVDDYLIVEHVTGRVDPKSGAFIPQNVFDYFPRPAKGIRQIAVDGGKGDDVIDVRNAGVAGKLSGGAGHDVLIGGTANDQLFGGAGDDTLWGGAGDDFLDGGAGHDHLFGQEGSDVLLGAAGDDYLDGGDNASRDRYVGGDGRDTAVVRTPPLSLKGVERVLDGWGY
jgi:Ca2+-binding RTX toxin-like protein